MARKFDPNVTAYVRHRLIGTDNQNVGELARRWKSAPATITNIRLGKTGVGSELALKIADVECGGSLDKLRADAREFVAAHHKLTSEYGVFARALGNLAAGEPLKATAYTEAMLRIVAFESAEEITVDQAEVQIKAEAAKVRGKAVGIRKLSTDDT